MEGERLPYNPFPSRYPRGHMAKQIERAGLTGKQLRAKQKSDRQKKRANAAP